MSWREQAACSQQSPELTGDTGWPRTPRKSQIHHVSYLWAMKLPICSRHRPGLLGRLQPMDSHATLVYSVYKKHLILEINTYTIKLHFFGQLLFLDSFDFWHLHLKD